MAYLKVDNASDLYDEKYIIEMAKEKTGFAYNLIPAVNSLQKYYNENFERLMMINFLPYYYNDYEEMKNNFPACNRFTQDDLQIFIKPFIEILDNESAFFFEHWEKLNGSYYISKQPTQDYFQKKLQKYSCIFDYFHKPCQILFSYIITKNGRGFYNDKYFAALIRYPENEAAYNFSFFQLLHEYTHTFTDGLLNKNINMKDGSHSLSENLVILADYFLIKSIDEDFIPKYFDWIKNGRIENLDERKFLNLFKIGEDLQAELMKLINRILETHTQNLF